MTTYISNSDDMIDSRDVIARIEALREELEGVTLNEETSQWERDGVNFSIEHEELEELESLADEASNYAPDWDHGETLIRDSYFKQYAETLAEDIGAIQSNAPWPVYCIDWDRAARELQMDYTAVDFDGVTYWIR